MKCPECKNQMKEIKIRVQDADNRMLSYQCNKCGYFEFEKKSAEKVIRELKQKESKYEKHEEEVYVSVSDKKRIIVNLQ